MKNNSTNLHYTRAVSNYSLLLQHGRHILTIVVLACCAFAAGCKKDIKTDAATADAISSGRKLRTEALPTRAEALVAIQVYNNNFYNQYGSYGPSFKAYYWKDQNHTS